MTPEKCQVPPAGWSCSREPGHDGPCAAIQVCEEHGLEIPGYGHDLCPECEKDMNGCLSIMVVLTLLSVAYCWAKFG